MSEDLEVRMQEFIVSWMRERDYEVPAAITSASELIEEIARQANETGWRNGQYDH